VHEDTRYLREQSDIHGAALDRLETRLDRQDNVLERHGEQLERLDTRLDGHGELLQEILRRLPSGPPDEA
jgi:hypothetical protein